MCRMNDVNVDNESRFPCPRCRQIVAARGWTSHQKKCSRLAQIARQDTDAGLQLERDKQELRPHLSKELALSQRDHLLGRIALKEQCFATERVMNITRATDLNYCLAASHVAAEQVSLGIGDTTLQAVAWIQPLLHSIFNSTLPWPTAYLENKEMDRILQPVWLPPPRTLGLNEHGAPDIVQDGNVPGSIEEMLSEPSMVLLHDVKRPRTPYSGVIRDVSDGLAWRNHPRSREGLHTLFLGHGADSTNLFCPIGMSHDEMKINFGHAELLNLSMQHRKSPMSHNMLTHICLDSLVKKYGPSAIVSGGRSGDGEWLEDSSLGGICRKSARGGHIIKPLSATKPQVISLLNSRNDNLGKHEYLASKASVSIKTHRICTCCNVTSSTRHLVCNTHDANCPVRLTTTYSHERDIEIVKQYPFASKWLGVNPWDHAFVGFPNQDAIATTAQDQVHNEYSNGLMSTHTNKFLRRAFSSTSTSEHHHRIDRTSFNQSLKDYRRWSINESHNIPSAQREKAFTGDGRILWTAAEYKTFTMHAERILADVVDHSDPHWVCYQKHIRCLRWFNDQPLSEVELVHGVQPAIIEHHEMYAELYGPDGLPPKFHYSHAHVVDDVLINGLPIETSTWFVERSHQRAKAIALHNFNCSSINSNICLLARKEMRHAAYLSKTHNFAPSSDFVAVEGSRHTSVQIDLSGTHRTDGANCEYTSLLASSHTIQALMDKGLLPSAGFECTIHERVKFQGKAITSGQHFVCGDHLYMVSEYLMVSGFCFITSAMYKAEIQRVGAGETTVASSLDSGRLCLIDTNVPGHTIRLVHIECHASSADCVYIVDGL
jgi:hypothetical protein